MERPETRLDKDHWKKWVARSRVPLGLQRPGDVGRTDKVEQLWLVIHTSKYDRHLSSTAKVVSTDGSGFESHRVYEDFYKTLDRVTARCTEKNITDLHNASLDQIEQLVALCKAHYTERGATPITA